MGMMVALMIIVFLLKVFDRDGHGWINTPELQEVRMAMKFPKK